MEFAFCSDDDFQAQDLLQGDLIRKSAEVVEALGQAHQYYAQADDYKYLAVITQSCDLVRRDGRFKAPYITVAAVRPLERYLERATASMASEEPSIPVRLGQVGRRHFATRLTDRLLNNSEKDVFFIRKSDALGIKEDLCIFLPLSIAMSSNHYDTLLNAKIAQMKSIFAAKLGWMVGMLYSRIGTPDLSSEVQDEGQYRKDFFAETVGEAILWLSKRQRQLLRENVRVWRADNKDQQITHEVLKELVDQVPNQRALLAQRVASVLVEKNLVESDSRGDVEVAILNDPGLFNLAKEVF